MNNDSITINTKNLRECRFYWRALQLNDFQLPQEPQAASDYCNNINLALHERFLETEERNKNITELKSVLTNSLIPNSELEWISPKDERLCYWIWVSCRLAIRDHSGWSSGLKLDFNQGDLDRPYIDYGVNPLPYTAQERYDFIIDFLDKSPANTEEKESYFKSGDRLGIKFIPPNIFLNQTRMTMNTVRGYGTM
ncbi:hypothetical protein [Vibrio algarum]|uniref:DUF2971 domain-containing protein n=1 Tax=Vibrio algarum TaxID=3020714 RepID=A0ABT4YL32_9VIBR|nr:hypothetical protein [Vibrio sp. KJ40-1]MDB1122244.1 hypothetical protein [Vibrio sp. KJ40-1]